VRGMKHLFWWVPYKELISTTGTDNSSFYGTIYHRQGTVIPGAKRPCGPKGDTWQAWNDDKYTLSHICSSRFSHTKHSSCQWIVLVPVRGANSLFVCGRSQQYRQIISPDLTGTKQFQATEYSVRAHARICWPFSDSIPIAEFIRRWL
jgi:hypothetical protein